MTVRWRGWHTPVCRRLTIQYHSEASPGPHDSEYLFDRFLHKVRERMHGTAGSSSVQILSETGSVSK